MSVFNLGMVINWRKFVQRIYTHVVCLFHGFSWLDLAENESVIIPCMYSTMQQRMLTLYEANIGGFICV